MTCYKPICAADLSSASYLGEPPITGNGSFDGSNVTVYEAARECEIRGKRLCNATEIRAETCCGSGCGFDGRLVWSSTECTTFIGAPESVGQGGGGGGGAAAVIVVLLILAVGGYAYYRRYLHPKKGTAIQGTASKPGNRGSIIQWALQRQKSARTRKLERQLTRQKKKAPKTNKPGGHAAKFPAIDTASQQVTNTSTQEGGEGAQMEGDMKL